MLNKRVPFNIEDIGLYEVIMQSWAFDIGYTFSYELISYN